MIMYVGVIYCISTYCLILHSGPMDLYYSWNKPCFWQRFCSYFDNDISMGDHQHCRFYWKFTSIAWNLWPILLHTVCIIYHSEYPKHSLLYHESFFLYYRGFSNRFRWRAVIFILADSLSWQLCPNFWIRFHLCHWGEYLIQIFQNSLSNFVFWSEVNILYQFWLQFLLTKNPQNFVPNHYISAWNSLLPLNVCLVQNKIIAITYLYVS